MSHTPSESCGHDRDVQGPLTAVDQAAAKQTVTRIVLMRVREDVPARTIEHIFGEIGAQRSKIAGILTYAWGPNSSPEGLGRGYTHGFCMTFVDAEARDAYLPHPEHQKVKSAVLAIVEDGSEGLLGFDFVS
jgi:hypothetical protein